MTSRSDDDRTEFDWQQGDADAGARDLPLEPWMLTLARDVGDDVAVPRDMMWKRIQQRRAATPVIVPTPVRATRWRGLAAIAAVLVGGIAIGRYSVSGARQMRTASVATSATAPIRTPPMTLEGSAAPARVAMQEHLVRTVALLTTVRDRDPALGPEPDVSSWARELLGTTRLLLDEPSLRDDRTRRLLQDLELVLMQILESRGTGAPEAQRAPTETMRETNLLPRVRAVVSASAYREDQTVHGDDE